MKMIQGYESHRDYPVRKFYLNPCCFGMWMHQNDADYLDIIEGTLLDSCIVSTKRGYAFISEHFVNTNQSNYLVTFVDRHNSEAVDSLFELFYETKEENESWL